MLLGLTYGCISASLMFICSTLFIIIYGTMENKKLPECILSSIVFSILSLIFYKLAYYFGKKHDKL